MSTPAWFKIPSKTYYKYEVANGCEVVQALTDDKFKGSQSDSDLAFFQNCFSECSKNSECLYAETKSDIGCNLKKGNNCKATQMT